MSKQVTPRQRAELARRKAMGIALIQRPLRFIGGRTNTIGQDAKGAPRKVLSLEYLEAYDCARRGNGQCVQSIARCVLA